MTYKKMYKNKVFAVFLVKYFTFTSITLACLFYHFPPEAVDDAYHKMCNKAVYSYITYAEDSQLFKLLNYLHTDFSMKSSSL